MHEKKERAARSLARGKSLVRFNQYLHLVVLWILMLSRRGKPCLVERALGENNEILIYHHASERMRPTNTIVPMA